MRKRNNERIARADVRHCGVLTILSCKGRQAEKSCRRLRQTFSPLCQSPPKIVPTKPGRFLKLYSLFHAQAKHKKIALVKRNLIGYFVLISICIVAQFDET